MIVKREDGQTVQEEERKSNRGWTGLGEGNKVQEKAMVGRLVTVSREP